MKYVGRMEYLFYERVVVKRKLVCDYIVLERNFFDAVGISCLFHKHHHTT